MFRALIPLFVVVPVQKQKHWNRAQSRISSTSDDCFPILSMAPWETMRTLFIFANRENIALAGAFPGPSMLRW